MTICVETVQKYGLDDYRTPVFVFERLSSIVYPEANDIGEFLLALEKDPQQEDFLQGRGCGTTSCVSRCCARLWFAKNAVRNIQLRHNYKQLFGFLFDWRVLASRRRCKSLGVNVFLRLFKLIERFSG